jgi:hypothetical protein
LFGFLKKVSDSPSYSSAIVFLCCWLCEELRENGSLLSDSPPHSSAIMFCVGDLCVNCENGRILHFSEHKKETARTEEDSILRSQDSLHCENGRLRPPVTRKTDRQ